MMLARSLALLSLTSLLGAQNLLVVPQSASTTDAGAMLGAPAIGLDHRLQVVIADTELTALVGRTIVGVKLRRDVSWTEALPAATAQAAIRIGHAAHGPGNARTDFAANLPQAIEVFRGTIQAPSSAAGPQAPSWSATDSIRIDFTQPFTYTGGPLCLEFDVLNAAGVWWPVDAIDDPVVGSVLNVGAACGPRADMVETAGVEQAALVIGRTATFHLVGQPLAPAWLLLGFGVLQNPFDLTSLGAPGCLLQLTPVGTIPTVLSPAIAEFGGHGLTNVDVHLPADTGLCGASIAAQFVELTLPGFCTSNALLGQIASLPPSLPMCVVVSRAGEPPDVRALGVPVVGLIWQ